MNPWQRLIRNLVARSGPELPRSEPNLRCDSQDTDSGDRNVFRFAPELFETRTDVIAELADRGFDWLSHYSSVDPIHDCYGIEVCGIRDQHDAASILDILIELFPDWRPG